MTSWSIKDKTVLITGATSGIGRQTAFDLAVGKDEDGDKPFKLILACRNLKAAQEVADEIEVLSPQVVVELVYLDLSSLESVQKCARKVVEAARKLDVLIANAGVFAGDRRHLTKDGLELTFETNHLGHFLLIELLKPVLVKESPTRIVLLSSDAYKFSWRQSSVTKYLDDVNFDRPGHPFSAGSAYVFSKLLNIFHCQALHERFQQESELSNVSVFAVHPGTAVTQLMRHRSWKFNLIFKPFLWMFGVDALQGAQTTLFCCREPDIDKYSGCYFKNRAVAQLYKTATSKPTIEKMWQLSETLVKDFLNCQ